MKLHFSKTFFVPLVVIVSSLSLTSCGKDYDLVSEYVVRDTTTKLLSTNNLVKSPVDVAVINNITSDTVEKKQ
ncbi:hypothetical protein [Maribacter sp. ACAM166]|uniref:hypothetical protein n=1 Tax=Maribacter sp. ACAM166 TaxID=2508996 RepID=UPI0010FF3038|nr:hypothetical protein [Maribacter sp. ACAM166]TLP75447.1 hypothetical protein ES765_15220 [Maribacter sp. ACAM166]